MKIYNKNRVYLKENLEKLGYEFVDPQGAFYLWIKVPDGDDKAFVNAAKEERILVVPGSTFGCEGYVRLAYCVDYDMIVRAMDGFRALAKRYAL